MDLVIYENGRAITSSVVVAMAFGKQHKNVIRDIEVLIANINSLKNDVDSKMTATNFGGSAESQQNQLEFNQSNFGETKTEVKDFFVESKYKDPSGKMNKCYILTRDGFSLLVMGFTGQKALEWKLKYINAFNYMENTLKRVQEIDVTNSREWELLKGSANSIVNIRELLQNDLKEAEKLNKRIEDHKVHIGMYGNQILNLTRDIERSVK